MIGVLHLSDIHIKESTSLDLLNNISERIKGVINEHVGDINNVIIVVSGDIAFSGQKEEYILADLFLETLKEYITSLKNINQVDFIIVPGNHDCDFSSDMSVRKTLMNNFNNEKGIIKEISKVQDNFMEFSGKYEVDYSQILSSQVVIDINNYKVGFDCYNLSWCSNRIEEQGKLVFPKEYFIVENNVNINISVFHHPIHWLEHKSLKKFKKHVELKSNLILTGHEHTPDFYQVKSMINETSVNYIEGNVLIEKDVKNSGINFIKIDSINNKYCVTLYQLDNNIYKSSLKKDNWIKIKNKDCILDVTEDFDRYLDDLGIELTHPNVSYISLSDLYVWPDLEIIEDDKFLNSDLYFNKIFQENKKIVIQGFEKSGKTSFSKMLYKKFKDLGYYPLIVKSKDVPRFNHKNKNEKLGLLLRDLITNQYGFENLDNFKQMDLEKKVFIFDDFHKLNNNKLQDAIINFYEKKFSRLLLTVDELFEISDVIGENFLALYKKVSIYQLSVKLRKQLIKKWKLLGDEYTLKEKGLKEIIDNQENIVNKLLGNKLFQPTPLYITLILQMTEIKNIQDLTGSSESYFYEELINKLLTMAGETQQLTNLMDSFLQEVAFYIFNKKQFGISEFELAKLKDRFYQLKGIRINFKIEKLNLFRKKNEQLYFKYPYIYYFFIGKYLNNNFNENKNLIYEIAGRLHNEINANIIIFLIHFKQDNELINEILKNGIKIFNDIEHCKLSEDVNFINKQVEKSNFKKLLLNNSSNDNNLDNENQTKYKEDLEISYDSESDEINMFSRFNSGVKIIKILGQILNSYPASIDKDIKKNIIMEGYKLSMRILGKIYGIISETDFQIIMNGIIETLNKEGDNDWNKLTPKKINPLYVNFLRFIALSLISIPANSFAIKIYGEIFDEIFNEKFQGLNSSKENSYLIMDFIISLKISKSFPEKKAKKVLESFSKGNFNSFAYDLVRHIIIRHLELEDYNFKEEQKILSYINSPIKTNIQNKFINIKKGIVKRKKR